MSARRTRTIITGHRKAQVEIVSERRTRIGQVLITVRRLRDAGAAPAGFADLTWNVTRTGDTTVLELSVLEARTIR